jgi:SAM-dependent methyltransferase
MDGLNSGHFESPANSSAASLSDQLSSLDWGFSSRSRVLEVESIHPYPAKFIGDIPRSLIELLPIPRSTVIFDPFCGSGTTLVEAQRAGYEAIGIDLNPIACLLSRVKTSELLPGFRDAAISAIDQASNLKLTNKRAIPNIDHWFTSDVQRAVGALTRTIEMPKYRDWADQLRLALSSILVRVSNQESDTRYAAVEKDVGFADVFSAFSAAVVKLDRALSQRSWKLPFAHVIEGDTLEVKSAQVARRVGLVITSPPYPNAYEYWLYHKYRMWWLGFDPLSVKEKEIGARAHFFKKNHHTAEIFVEQMRQTFRLIDSVLVARGFVCFVVGRSKIHGRIVDNAAIIKQVAAEISLSPIARIERAISPHRKSFNLSHANIKSESLLVFQKQ